MSLSTEEMQEMSHKVLKQVVAESGLKFGPVLTHKVRSLAKALDFPQSRVAQFVRQLIEEMTNEALRLLL